jgi:hypothetical protein
MDLWAISFHAVVVFGLGEDFAGIPYTRHYNPRFVHFYPKFEVHFFVFKEVFWENCVLMYG